MTKIIEKKEKQYAETKNICKYTKNASKNVSENASKNISLDTLAQLYPNSKNIDISLLKKAKAKHLTNAYTKQLAMLNTKLKKSYNNTYFGCNTELIQTENKITAKYCNNRWCIVCNRIRTAKMINGYYPVLNEINNKYFVTLTIPNIPGVLLKWQIKDMIRNFQNIRRYIHRTKLDLKGLRKLECTYNPITRHFHPHFHLIVESRDVAELIVKRWLIAYPDANIKAQDIRIADNGSLLEMFKYFSKIINKDKIYIKSLDKIFVAMSGLRVYQNFGIKRIEEDIEELKSEEYNIQKLDAVWQWYEQDWYNTETGEELTGYKPSQRVVELIEKIVKR